MANDKPVEKLVPLARRECEERQRTLIAHAKALAPFGPVEWDSPDWNVTGAFATRVGSSRGDATIRLNFTQHRPKTKKDGVGEPFDAPFSDIAKALVCSRYSKRNQGANNQQTYINAFRFLHDVLRPSGRAFLELTHIDFDLAWEACQRSRMKLVTLRKFKGFLKQVADDIDRYRITAIRLNWDGAVNPHQHPDPDSEQAGTPSPANPRRDGKLPSEEVIRAVGWLYQHIPREDWADRVLICFSTIACFLGYRSADLLKLPALPVQYDANRKAYYLVRYGSKRGKPGIKIIPTAAVEIITEAIDELLSLTRDVRATATWLHLNPGKAYLGRMRNNATLEEAVEAIVGLAGPESARDYLEKEGVRIFEGRVTKKEVERKLGKSVKSTPCYSVLGGTRQLWMKDCLAVCFVDAMHRGSRWTKEHSVCPISHQHLRDFLCGKNKKPSVFVRYALYAADGTVLTMRTHGPRHFVNDIFDRGGLSEFVQAEWFGRKDIGDNKAYQHTSDFEYAEAARQLLREGTLFGAFAQQVKREPVEQRDAVIAAKIHFVHKTQYGMCIRDFSQQPCDLYGECLDDCESHLMDPFNDATTSELSEKRRFLVVALRAARKAHGVNVYGADSAAAMYQRELAVIRKVLRRRAAGMPACSCGQHELDPAQRKPAPIL